MFDELIRLKNKEFEAECKILNIRKLASQLSLLNEDLRSIRKKKADEIRRLYFEKRAKQTEIAKIAEVPQGSISRIVSQQVYSDSPRYCNSIARR